MKHAALVTLLAVSLYMLPGVFPSGARAEGAQPWVPGELIVKFKPGTSEGQKSALISGYKIDDISFIGAEVWLVGEQAVEDAVFALNSSSIVEYAEPNYLLYTYGIPNDAEFGGQWNMHNIGQSIADIPGIADADIDAPEAWDLYTGSSSAVVAVIDTGVDCNHPDLAGNIWHNSGEIAGNSIDDDANGYIDDVRGWDFFANDNDVSDENGHGTHCAGIVGAVGNNGLGVAGVNWGVRIMPIRAYDMFGAGDLRDAVDAVGYAVKMGADVINASWGSPESPWGLKDAIFKAGEAGVFFVAAAGNDYHDIDLDAFNVFPACFDTGNIITVMATNHRDEKAPFSNYGATSVDIAAPGFNIGSTVPNDEYSAMSGTSMAAPHVSGAMAMLRGRFPNITVEQGKSLLLESGCDYLSSLNGLCVSGGRLNLRKLIEAAIADTTAPAQIADLAVTTVGSTRIDLRWTASGDDGQVGRARFYDVRFATSAILTEADWGTATPATGEPGPQTPGSQEIMQVIGLTVATTYYFAIKACDEVNGGEISNCVVGATLGPPTIRVTPSSLSAALAIGGSESQNLQIANVGEGILDFYVIDGPEWLNAVPNAGSVAAGDTANIAANFDATGLCGDQFLYTMSVHSNDAAADRVPIMATLDLLASPEVQVTPTSLAFGDVLQTQQATLWITVRNAGCNVLSVEEILIDNPAFSVSSFGPFDVPVGQERQVNVVFAPGAAGEASGIMTLRCNDPNNSLVPVTLSGFGVAPGIADIAPTSVSRVVLPNQLSTAAIRITNNGTGPLDFTVPSPVLYTALLAMTGGVAPPDTISPLGGGGPDICGYSWKDSDAAGGPSYSWIDIGDTGIVALEAGHNVNSGPFPIGFAFNYYGTTYNSFRVCSNGYITFEDVSATHHNIAIPSVSAPHGMLAAFWDYLDLDSSYAGDILYQNVGGNLVVQWDGIPRSGTDVPITFEIVLTPSGTITYQYQSVGFAMTNSTTVGIQDGTGTVGLQVVFDSNYLKDGLAVQFTRPPQWVTVSPASGVLPAGSSTDLTLTFDSTEISLGSHFGVLRITTSDPLRRRIDVPLVLEVVNGSFDENAVYRFRAGSTDTSYVLAVSMSAPPEWRQVTANLTSVSGPANMELKDDGVGEDVKSGDGIFTSSRFAASMPIEGVYAAAVTAEPMVGGSVTRSVSMAAIGNEAQFTADANLPPSSRIAGALTGGLAARPYAAVYFWSIANDDASDKVMISTFDDNTTPPGIWGRTSPLGGSDGEFESRGLDGPTVWLDAELPAGSRGVCYADFDNDGDTDFFLCNPSDGGRLYVNHLYDTTCPVAWRGKFIDQTAEVFGPDTFYLDGAVTASWGDYTGDGFVDLFVATTTYSGPIDEIDELECPMAGTQPGVTGGDLRLFKNTMGSSLRKSLVWGSGSSTICLAGSWVDLDNDGDLDLVSTRMAGNGLSVLENWGVNATHTDQTMNQVTWPLSDTCLGANSLSVIDYNHDGFADLIITEATSTQKRALVACNMRGLDGSRGFVTNVVGSGEAWNGAVVADFNLDGQDDFVLLPKSEDVVPAFYVSNGYTTAPEIEDPNLVTPMPGTTPLYRDLGYTLGLRDGSTGGGFAADLDGDHAPDLFLGRSETNQFLYRSATSTSGTNHWLQVRLRTVGDSNGSLVGTKVEVVSELKHWDKRVDGGSVRGGQSTNDLLFGLGGESNVDYVLVTFPSGEVDSITNPSVDVPLTVWEDGMDNVTYNSPPSSYELHPGTVDTVFRWKSGSIKGDLRCDEVVVRPLANPNNPCYDEFDPEPEFTLRAGMPDVSGVVFRVGAIWVHELRWSNFPCTSGCRWSFTVSSGAGAGGATRSTSQPAATAPVSYCIPENYGQ